MADYNSFQLTTQGYKDWLVLMDVRTNIELTCSTQER